jgi:hypothetical protein
VTYSSLQVFGVTHDSHPGLDGHVFPNPVDPTSYVAMLVHKNGSLSREGILHNPTAIPFMKRSFTLLRLHCLLSCSSKVPSFKTVGLFRGAKPVCQWIMGIIQ